MNKVLQANTSNMTGLNTNVPVTGKALRNGALDTMASNPSLGWHAIIARGGWFDGGESRAFIYLNKKRFVRYSGNVLSGWGDPQEKVCPPCFFHAVSEDPTDETHLKLLNVMEHLWGHQPKLLETKLILLSWTMLASLCMHRKAFLIEYPESLVERRVGEALLECLGYGWERQWAAWGQKIHAMYTQENMGGLGFLGTNDEVPSFPCVVSRRLFLFPSRHLSFT